MYKLKLNKRGVALLQVLIVSAILAGLATMILRVVMSRATAAHKVRQTVLSQMMIESCMNEVNNLWMNDPDVVGQPMPAEKYAAFLGACRFPTAGAAANPANGRAQYDCNNVHNALAIRATIAEVDAANPNPDGIPCQITYSIVDGVTNL